MHGLHDQLELVGPAGRARAGRRQRSEPAAARPVGLGQERARQQAAVLADHRREALQGGGAHPRRASTSAKAAAAASTVRSTSSGAWARDGNQASNCDGGG